MTARSARCHKRLVVFSMMLVEHSQCGLLKTAGDQDEDVDAACSAVARIPESAWVGSRCARREAMVADAMAPTRVTSVVHEGAG